MKHIAIIGCGQLARMMALAGWHQNIRFSFVAEPSENTACVKGLGDVITFDGTSSAAKLYNQLGKPDVITVEKEHVNIDLLEALSQHTQVYPNPECVRIARDRSLEKAFLTSIDIPVAPYIALTDPQDLPPFFEQHPRGVIVKSTRNGYDGLNQWVIRNQKDLDAFLTAAPSQSAFVAESLIDFDAEVSIIAVRSTTGKKAFYPLCHNIHHKGILNVTLSPAILTSKSLDASAKALCTRILEATDYVGVLCVEFFVVKNQLLVNEIAPRVHNSGHWTMNGARTSQFENHIRAICGQTLGDTQATGYAANLNILSDVPKDIENALSQESLYLYNKSPRQNRKLGHINVVCDQPSVLINRIKHLLEIVYPMDAKKIASQLPRHD